VTRRVLDAATFLINPRILSHHILPIASDGALLLSEMILKELFLYSCFRLSDLGQRLQDTEDSNEGALHLDRLLGQYPGYIGV